MKAEEKFLKDVMLILGSQLDEEKTKYVEMVLLNELDGYTLETNKETKQLPSDITLRNEMFLKQFLISISIQGLSEKTIKSYQYTIQKFLGFVDMDLMNPNSNEIKRYLASLKINGNKSTTLANNRSILSAFFQWMSDEEYIRTNPMNVIKPIKVQKEIKKPLKNVEIARLKDACQTKREKALLEFMLSTGVRVEEVTKIKLSDVNFNNNSIIINGKGNKQRVVYMSDVANMYIGNYLKDRESKGIDSEYLFCVEVLQNIRGIGQVYTPLNTNTVRMNIKKISERANVKNNHPHRLRRTFACNMLKQTDLMTVSHLLGHSNLDTTKIYLENDESKSAYECSKRVIF